MSNILVLGAGGFIGSHLVKKLKAEGHYVVGVDLQTPEFSRSAADKFVLADLRYIQSFDEFSHCAYDEVYQLAADMGGAGYIFSGLNDANVMSNNALININVLNWMVEQRLTRVFFSSSACMYPEYNQLDPDNPVCTEESAYPAAPDSEYGWEKLFSERLYLSFARNHGLHVRIGRYHNIYGPESAWTGGREKSPAALCRKVQNCTDTIDVWGTGKQTRSFLYINDCVEATIKLLRSEVDVPLNIGSEEMISINDFVQLIATIEDKAVAINNIDGPVGVNGRCSDNTLCKKLLQWEPTYSLKDGITLTYNWIKEQNNNG